MSVTLLTSFHWTLNMMSFNITTNICTSGSIRVIVWNCEDRGVCSTHLSLIIVCNSRIWSFRGSSLSWGPMLSWFTACMVSSPASRAGSTAGTVLLLLLLLLANRTCFIGCSWPLLTLLSCWLWHGILGARLRVSLQICPEAVFCAREALAGCTMSDKEDNVFFL